MRHAEFPSTTTAIFRPFKFCWYRIFLSVVSKISKPAASAFVSKSPLEILSQPRSMARVTSWPVSESAIPLGVPWSNRTRIADNGRVNTGWPRLSASGGEIEHGLNLLACHVKLLDDFLNVGAGSKILEYSGNRHPGIPKHPRATQPPRHAFHCRTLRPVKSCHFQVPFPPASVEAIPPMSLPTVPGRQSPTPNPSGPSRHSGKARLRPPRLRRLNRRIHRFNILHALRRQPILQRLHPLLPIYRNGVLPRRAPA